MTQSQSFSRQRLLAWLGVLLAFAPRPAHADTLGTHTVVLDGQNKIIPWITPVENAFGKNLDLLWSFIVKKVPNGPSSNLKMYYLYCGFQTDGDNIVADAWMNDVGEKIPNWFESARLYYAYSGDPTPLEITRGLMDYSLAHGITPANYAWPNFPQTAANAGATEFRGFTERFNRDDVHVDLAGDMGVAFFRMFLYTADNKYLTAATNVANTLAKKIRPDGTKTEPPWPYVVNANTGEVVSDYTSNWFGCVTLFDLLIDAGLGDLTAYQSSRQILRDWLLAFPLRNGLWVDGHSDTKISGTDNLSHTCASNATLYLLEHPAFDPNWQTNLAALLAWAEEHFIFNCSEPAIQWGAYTVAEQEAFKWKMGYQTARYAAACAGWYRVTGNAEYRDRAYRSLAWTTYFTEPDGRAQDGPTETVGHWWSDCYGEYTRMFYPIFAAIPEFAPPRENHILYSTSVLKNVAYAPNQVEYTPTDSAGTETIRLSFRPTVITLAGNRLIQPSDPSQEGYLLKDLGGGDFVLTIYRLHSGRISISNKVDTTPPAAPKNLVIR